ncbi:MAG: copper chaperone PCu(A)C [Methylovirgula sp.]
MNRFRCSRRTALALVFTLAAGQALAASAQGNAQANRPAGTQLKASATGPGLKIIEAWARATPQGAKVGAGYLRIVNTGKMPDRLIGISSPAASRVDLHQSVVVNAIAEMRPVVGGLEIPAGGTVTLKPGSYHIMFQGLKAPFKKGGKVKATLDFKNAGKIPVAFTVKGIGAGAP